MLEFERLCISDWQTVSAADIEAVAAVATFIDNEIKSGRKKVTAVKAIGKL